MQTKIRGFALTAAIASALVVGGLLVASQVFAASGSVKVGSASAKPGASAVVDLNALGVTTPGLGAWTIDINYDPDVVTATGCSAAQGGVCNANYAADQVRIDGAVAHGLLGDSLLGTITFKCGATVGASPLKVTLFTFADGTLGGPLDINGTAVDGTLTCANEVVVLPSTGTGSASDGIPMTWVIASLVLFGLVSMAAYGALRLRTNRA